MSEPQAQSEAPPEICIERLHKRFGDNVVLRGVELVVRRGDLIALVGGSGSGKTVLLDHILGQLRPDRGRVLAVDHTRPDAPLTDLVAASEAELERIHMHWGVVFQRNALFSGTVYENLALGLDQVRHLSSTKILPIAKSALSAVGLRADSDFLDMDPTQLSGGMAKRLAVARALAMDPAVMFYDEPTTGLDPSTAGQIQNLIHETHVRERLGGRTSVIITHDKDLIVRLQPRVVLLHEGRVAFDGSYQEFMESASPEIRPYFDRMPVLHRGGREH